MVAAMHIQNENDRTAFGPRTTELRNIAIGFAVAIALLMVAGQITDSGSASGSALDDTVEKRFVAPVPVTSPTSTATEDVAYSSTITWTDGDGTDVALSCSGCSGWITFTDGGGSANTATITGTPADADVGADTITITGTSAGESTQLSYTITTSQVNDEPTVSASAAGGTYTEDGSNVVMFTSADVADSDSQVAQTWAAITVTITNVADEDEYLVIDGTDCDITASATCNANTATNSGSAVVTLNSGTATVVWTADAGTMTDSLMEALINALAYKNTDHTPTEGARVITITTLQDAGGTADSGDDSVTVSIAATATVVAVDDDPTIDIDDDTLSGTEDTNFEFNEGTDGWDVNEYEDNDLTVTLAVDQGSLTLGSIANLAFSTGDGTADATMTFVATDTETNAATDTTTWVASSNFFGDVTLTITINDGSGSNVVDTLVLTIAADNDAPVNTVGSAVTTNEDVAVDITGNSIADVDDTSLTAVTISSTQSGTLTLAGISGLTFAGGGGDGTDDNTMTFSGTIANINTAIATIEFTSASNDNTDAVVTIVSNDGDDTDTDTIAVTINAVNDPPTLSATSTNPTHTEDAGAVSLYTNTAATAGGTGGDSESEEIDLFTMQITNVQDTAENIAFDGSTIPISVDGGSGHVNAKCCAPTSASPSSASGANYNSSDIRKHIRC